ncbi:unnamed protein product [Prunus armeniaca]
MRKQALKVSQENHSPRRGRGRGRGGFRGRQGSFDKSNVECYYCHEMGHFQYECPKKEYETKANVAKTEEELLLMAYVEVKGEQINNT